MDLYNYQVVTVTSRLSDAISHLLSASVRRDVSKTLVRELETWRESGTAVDNNVRIENDCRDIISFSLLMKVHNQLKQTPLGNNLRVSLVDLLGGCSLVLPAYKPPPRNPQLEARLNKIKVSLEQKEYNIMVGKSPLKENPLQDLRLDIQETHRQLIVVINFLFTVIGSFIFAYSAGYYAGFDNSTCCLMALVCGIIVFLADLYFISKRM